MHICKWTLELNIGRAINFFFRCCLTQVNADYSLIYAENILFTAVINCIAFIWTKKNKLFIIVWWNFFWFVAFSKLIKHTTYFWKLSTMKIVRAQWLICTEFPRYFFSFPNDHFPFVFDLDEMWPAKWIHSSIVFHTSFVHGIFIARFYVYFSS